MSDPLDGLPTDLAQRIREYAKATAETAPAFSEEQKRLLRALFSEASKNEDAA